MEGTKLVLGLVNDLKKTTFDLFLLQSKRLFYLSPKRERTNIKNEWPVVRAHLSRVFHLPGGIHPIPRVGGEREPSAGEDSVSWVFFRLYLLYVLNFLIRFKEASCC